MRQYFVSGLTDSEDIRYVGTMGLGPCIGVVLVTKKDGKIHRVGMGHVDAMTSDLGALAYYSFQDADEAKIYLIASYGSRETALGVLKFINYTVPEKSEFFIDLRSSSSIVVDIETGDVSNTNFEIGKDTFISSEEFNRAMDSFAKFRVYTPSSLEPSKEMSTIFLERDKKLHEENNQ